MDTKDSASGTPQCSLSSAPPGEPPEGPTDEGELLESIEVEKADWKKLVAILPHALSANLGCVSSIELNRRLKENGVREPQRTLSRLKFLDWSSDTPSFPRPSVRVYHVGRSFLDAEAHKKHLEEREAQADQEAAKEVASEPTARPRKQDEARLVSYVCDELSNMYTNDWDEKRPCVFKVHERRPLSDYENVDVLAVRWRSAVRYDVVAVEVKLRFSAQLIQQANNYRRFADRVWIACPVESPLDEAANWLQSENQRLFDYAVDSGLGILACKRMVGRRYEVVPVHWPMQNRCDPVDRDALLEAYFDQFIEAGVATPAQGRFL